VVYPRAGRMGKLLVVLMDFSRVYQMVMRLDSSMETWLAEKTEPKSGSQMVVQLVVKLVGTMDEHLVELRELHSDESLAVRWETKWGN
jgi:hypothetical protein